HQRQHLLFEPFPPELDPEAGTNLNRHRDYPITCPTMGIPIIGLIQCSDLVLSCEVAARGPGILAVTGQRDTSPLSIELQTVTTTNSDPGRGRYGPLPCTHLL